MPNPLAEPELFDKATIGGFITPGVHTLKGASDPRKFDVAKGYGTSGGTVKFTGLDELKFTMHVACTTKAEVQYWLDFIDPVLRKVPTKQDPATLSFFSAWAPHIDSVQVEDPGQMELDDAGLWSIDVKLIRYLPAKPGLGKANASGKGFKAGEHSKQDEQDAQIDALTKEMKELWE